MRAFNDFKALSTFKKGLILFGLAVVIVLPFASMKESEGRDKAVAAYNALTPEQQKQAARDAMCRDNKELCAAQDRAQARLEQLRSTK